MYGLILQNMAEYIRWRGCLAFLALVSPGKATGRANGIRSRRKWK
jgi:hypothetical protein